MDEWVEFSDNLAYGLTMALIEEGERNPKFSPSLFEGKMNVTLMIPKSVAELFASLVPSPHDQDGPNIEETEKFIDGVCSMIFFAYGINGLYLKVLKEKK